MPKLTYNCPICGKQLKLKEEFTLGDTTLYAYTCGHVFPRSLEHIDTEKLDFTSKDGSGKHARHYQEDGVKFILEHDFNAIIADQMRLGKTPQALLALANKYKERTPVWYSHTIWKWSDGANPEKLVEGCGYAYDIDPGGKYLLALFDFGEKPGVYEVPISERKCIPLLPSVTSGASFAPDSKSLLYAVASRGEVSIYRQPWKDGRVIETPQVALKLPFTFPLIYGLTYDFSRDLSTIVYARPGGHADLYLLSQK